MTKVTEKPDAEQTEPRRPPSIDPRLVVKQADGFAYKELSIRLPRDMTLADLQHPEIWRRVQSSPHALVRLDKVRLIAFDESWLCECIVTGATATGATLSKPVKIDLPPRQQVLPGDENYQVAWDGAAYAVVRRRDGALMGAEATVSGAVRFMESLYPKAA